MKMKDPEKYIIYENRQRFSTKRKYNIELSSTFILRSPSKETGNQEKFLTSTLWYEWGFPTSFPASLVFSMYLLSRPGSFCQYVAIVHVRLGERPKNGLFGVLPSRNGARVKIRKSPTRGVGERLVALFYSLYFSLGNSSLPNPTKTLATHARRTTSESIL